jgi:flagellar export protein FliJ
MNTVAAAPSRDGPSPWAVLRDRARRRADRAIEALALAQRERERLRHSRSRVQTMLREYGARLQRLQAEAHAIAEAVNQREFLGHLRRLDERVGRQLLQADRQVEQLRAGVVAAEQEVAKLAQLLEREERAHRDLAARREQRQLDDWAVMQAGLRAALAADEEAALRREA